MTETCSKCGRPSLYGANRSEPESMIAAAKYGWCEGERTMVCREQAAGFKRGAAWMLETAKREATIAEASTDTGFGNLRFVDLSKAEAALEARGK